MEKAFSNEKTVWVKWYKPTDVGRWIVLLFLPLKEVNPELVEKTLKQLFELYIRNAIQLCETYNIDAKVLKAVAEESLR
jgi:hypothetical protein